MRIVDAFADAILALDDSMPNGTYVDMCSRLPVDDPAKITVPTIVLRGQYDGIAGFDDLIEFFKRAARSRQAVRRDAGHLARELPAEELPAGLPHPARVLHAAEAARYTGRRALSRRLAALRAGDVWCFVALFAGYAVRGAAGFGSGVVATPLMAFVLPLSTVAPLVTFLGVFVSVRQALRDWNQIAWRHLAGVRAGDR